MNVGMLWFDNDNKSNLPEKVKRAATYYHGKYGVQPNLCFVHPSMAKNVSPDIPEPKSMKSGPIEVRLTKSVLPHHFWIGVHKQETN